MKDPALSASPPQLEYRPQLPVGRFPNHAVAVPTPICTRLLADDVDLVDRPHSLMFALLP